MAGLSPFPQPPPTLLLLEAPRPLEQRFLSQFLPQVSPVIFASLLGFFRVGLFALLPRLARPLVSSATARLRRARPPQTRVLPPGAVSDDVFYRRSGAKVQAAGAGEVQSQVPAPEPGPF